MKKEIIKYSIYTIIFLTIVIGYVYPKPKEQFVEETVEETKVEIPSKVITTESEYIVEQKIYTTRMTSYWVNDDCNSTDMTASGKSSKDFKLNENGWYTWNDMLVIATASERLGKTNQRTYKLYEILELKIKGKTYKAVVLDVCGACMRDNRIDLYVKDKQHMIDQKIEIVER